MLYFIVNYVDDEDSTVDGAFGSKGLNCLRLMDQYVNSKLRFPSTQQYGYTINQYSDWIFIATCFGLQATIIRQ
jgi:hypothetical protein